MPPRATLALAAVLALSPVAFAQTAAELLVVTSISSTLDSATAIRLPTGTSFVTNAKYAGALTPALLGAEAAKFKDVRLYTARGLATRLADSYINDLKTQFAVSGFFESGSRAVKVGADTWTRTDFAGDSGGAFVLFVAKKTDGVYFLTAQAK